MLFVFIDNPTAGNDDQKKILSRIKSTFRQLPDEMIIEETQGPNDAMRIAKEYAEKYGDKCIVVSCGGDGTVHEIANGLCETETPMMILPLGTGNDFAKKVYDTKKINVENVIKAFGFYNGKISYEVKPIDIIDYNGEKCINVMSFGLDTLVETIGKKIAAKVPSLGHQAYNLAIFPVVCKPLHYTISYDITCVNDNGEEYKMQENNKDFALFAICNASYYGGGYCPAPDSKLDDGILDFALVDGLPLHKALPLIPKYSAGTLTEENSGGYVHMGKLKSGRIWMEDGSNLLGNCDGENFEYNEINFRVLPKALKLCYIKD